MINFEKPALAPTEVDITDDFIERLNAYNIRSIKVNPVWHTSNVDGVRVRHEMKTRLVDDIGYIIDQLVEQNAEIVFVREVARINPVPGLAAVTYRVRIDALFVGE